MLSFSDNGTKASDGQASSVNSLQTESNPSVSNVMH